MKKLMSLLLVLTLVITVFVGCTGSKEGSKADSSDASVEGEVSADSSSDDKPVDEGKSYTIGIASNNYQDKWQTYLNASIEETAKDYPNFTYDFADAEEDASKQLGQVEDFITSGVDGIILIAVQPEAAGPITKACSEANIPLVTVNRLLTNQDEAAAYVGSESVDAGIMAAEVVYEKLGGKGNVVILMGPAGNEATVERTRGYKDVAAEKYPDIKFVAEEYGNWNRDEGMKIVEDWIQGGIEFDAILANNDEMAMGAVIALEGAKIRDKVIVAGIDATPDALEFMKEGRLDVTVYQSAGGQGKAAFETMVKAIEGTLTETEIWVPYELVLPEQVDEYIAKWA